MQAGYKYTIRLKFKLFEGVLLAGVTWAPGNLIYSGTYPTGTYSFASTQEYYSSTWNGGDYWGWCQLNPTVITSYSGGYSAAVDPCQQVAPAGTWRMPTQTELVNLINATYVWTTKNGINGRYFGTTTVPATGTENNYLFLPAAGYRVNASTTMDNVGTYGYYWSSTPESTPHAYGLNNAGVSYYSRNFGFAIRCVK